MAEKKKDRESEPSGGEGQGTATAKPKRSSKPKNKPPQMLPPWKVMLHNDDKNDMHFVVRTIVELTPLKQQEAELRTLKAHRAECGHAAGDAQGASGAVPGAI